MIFAINPFHDKQDMNCMVLIHSDLGLLRLGPLYLGVYGHRPYPGHDFKQVGWAKSTTLKKGNEIFW